MKVFLSWSGDASKRAASLLREWLPTVIQALEPYMSEEDIAKGTRWGPDLDAELEEAKAGIICLTHENVEKPWLHFEAGAISKTVDVARVCPLLLGLDVSDVKGPLARFQETKMEKDDMRRLLGDLNDAEGETLVDQSVLDISFKKMWPDLQTRMEPIIAQSREVEGTSEPEGDSGLVRSILEELLEASRQQARLLTSLERHQMAIARAAGPPLLNTEAAATAAGRLERALGLQTGTLSKLGPPARKPVRARRESRPRRPEEGDKT